MTERLLNAWLCRLLSHFAETTQGDFAHVFVGNSNTNKLIIISMNCPDFTVPSFQLLKRRKDNQCNFSNYLTDPSLRPGQWTFVSFSQIFNGPITTFIYILIRYWHKNEIPGWVKNCDRYVCLKRHPFTWEVNLQRIVPWYKLYGRKCMFLCGKRFNDRISRGRSG